VGSTAVLRQDDCVRVIAAANENTPDTFLAGGPGHSRAIAIGKRIFDIGVIIAAAPAAVLLIGLAGLAIYITSGGPVFFVQERVGLRGQPFRMLKLRTMTAAPRRSRAIATSVGDQRITPLGAALRQYRIDELPQLLNVLLGHMSLIGPRLNSPRWSSSIVKRCQGLTSGIS